MIICTPDSTKLEGTTLELIQDFANITRSLRETFGERYGEMKTSQIIGICGRLAFTNSASEADAVLGELVECLLGDNEDGVEIKTS